MAIAKEKERRLSHFVIPDVHEYFLKTNGRELSTKEEMVEVLDKWYPYGWFFLVPIGPDEDGEVTYERVDKTTFRHLK